VECSSNGDLSKGFYYTQTEANTSLPFNSETTILTLPVTLERNLQPVKIDSSVQISAVIALGLTSYQYTVLLRLYRNGVLLTTKTLTQGAALSLSLSFTQVLGIPITFVDDTSLLGTNTYTITAQFSQRSSASVTTSVQSRAMNGTVYYK
jgi:hypothetical protein